jgi:hypothetical protein
MPEMLSQLEFDQSQWVNHSCHTAIGSFVASTANDEVLIDEKYRSQGKDNQQDISPLPFSITPRDATSIEMYHW